MQIFMIRLVDGADKEQILEKKLLPIGHTSFRAQRFKARGKNTSWVISNFFWMQ